MFYCLLKYISNILLITQLNELACTQIRAAALHMLQIGNRLYYCTEGRATWTVHMLHTIECILENSNWKAKLISTDQQLLIVSLKIKIQDDKQSITSMRTITTTTATRKAIIVTTNTSLICCHYQTLTELPPQCSGRASRLHSVVVTGVVLLKLLYCDSSLMGAAKRNLPFHPHLQPHPQGPQKFKQESQLCDAR